MEDETEEVSCPLVQVPRPHGIPTIPGGQKQGQGGEESDRAQKS